MKMNKNKIENGNGECVKEQQPDQRADNSRKATNGSSMQWENSKPGDVIQLAPKQAQN